MPVAPPRSPERLLLVLGTAIVIAGGISTTLADFEASGAWTVHGLQRALIGLTAIWLLFGVLRLARAVTDRSASGRA
jgi:hypothetical protein